MQDVVIYFRKAHIYAHAATEEPFGLAILEAMSTGLPVVSLDGGGNRDLFGNGEAGFLLSEKSPKFFAEKILEIISSTENYHRFSSQAAKDAQAFDIKVYVDKLLQLYELHARSSR